MCDQEPSMMQLQGLAMNARKRLGFKTRIRNPPIGEHQANGFAEKSIDVIRSLANVFLDSARHKYKIEIPVSHPLFSWSFVPQPGCIHVSRSEQALRIHRACTNEFYSLPKVESKFDKSEKGFHVMWRTWSKFDLQLSGLSFQRSFAPKFPKASRRVLPCRALQRST